MLTNLVFEGLMNAFLQNESFFKREFDDGNILSINVTRSSTNLSPNFCGLKICQK